MLITETVKYYGADISVNELSTNSDKKVLVRCPDCFMVRKVYWKVLIKSKDHRCHTCSNKLNAKNIQLGTRFHRLIVIDSKRVGYSICKCDCGEIIEVYNNFLRRGHTKSCGCLKYENFNNSHICTGEKHGNWKGGITPENVAIRTSVNYKDWITSVFSRDNYTCQKCGQVGYELNAHHLDNFALNQDKRLDINNGATLCKKCHKEIHRVYGNKTTQENFIEFINIKKNNMKTHILRNSESNINPKLVEYLQEGILIRFNIQQAERTGMNEEISIVFKYKEFWFDLEEPNIESIVSENGFELTDEYKQLIK